MTAPDLFRMSYAAECDGYDRQWHATFAKNRSELDQLVRGRRQKSLRGRLEADSQA